MQQQQDALSKHWIKSRQIIAMAKQGRKRNKKVEKTKRLDGLESQGTLASEYSFTRTITNIPQKLSMELNHVSLKLRQIFVSPFL